MSVRRGNYIWTGAVHTGMDREGRSIHRVFSFHDLALMVHKNQIRSANLPEMHAERIDPEMIEFFGIAGGDMSRDAFVEPKTREKPEGSGEHSFASWRLFSSVGAHRRDRALRSDYLA